MSAGAITIARRYGIGWLQQLLGEILGIGGQQHADESHDIELTRSETDDNNGAPPRESPTTEREGTDETGNSGPPQDQSLATEREGEPSPTPTDPVATERDDAPLPSSSSSTTEPLHTSEPHSPVLASQSDDEIVEV